MSTSFGDLAQFLQSPAQWPAFDKYTPLDQARQEIRLIQLSRNEADEIHLYIQHVSLMASEPAPKYDALSYYWGPPDELKPVFVHGQPVYLRATVYKFLWQLCEHGQELPIWLDIISIDQQNSAERSWQVTLMGEIYKTATTVKAWLGDIDPDANYALGYSQHYQNQMLQTSEYYSDVEKRALQSFKQLAKRPYWERVWIVQEVCLAQSVEVMCGNRQVAWPEMVSAAMTLDDGQHSLDRILQLNDIRNKGLKDEDHHDKSSLLKLALHFASRLCQDPRDKIFGFRSLTSQQPNIPVDYGKPLVEPVLDALITSFNPVFETPDGQTGFERLGHNDFEQGLLDGIKLVETLSVSNAMLLAQLSQARGNADSGLRVMLTSRSYAGNGTGSTVLFSLAEPNWEWIFPLDWSDPSAKPNSYQLRRGRENALLWVAKEHGEFPLIGDIFLDLFDVLISTHRPPNFYIVLRQYSGALRIVGVLYEGSQQGVPKNICLIHAVLSGHIQVCQKADNETHPSTPWCYLHFTRVGVLVMVNRLSGNDYKVRESLSFLKLLMNDFKSVERNLCVCPVSGDDSKKIRLHADWIREYTEQWKSWYTYPWQQISNLLHYYSFHHYQPGVNRLRQLMLQNSSSVLNEFQASLSDKLLAETDLEKRKQLMIDHFYPEIRKDMELKYDRLFGPNSSHRRIFDISPNRPGYQPDEFTTTPPLG